MKIEPFLIASTVRSVVGQRLVRKVNTEECEQYTPNENDIKEIEKTFKIEGTEAWNRIFELTKQADPKSNIKSLSDIKLWRPKAKLEKGQTGYKGRQGIYEVLVNTPEIQKMIMANATSEDLNNQAIKEGMVTMFMDGLVRALIGQTSIEEVLRVTRD
jgi:type II secretory ATPase GspE/PulE/Tfp pilus assembly ATPase PilB-like protein